MTNSERINKALDIIANHGGHDGEHHKDWVLDQVTRILTGEAYDKFVNYVTDGHPEEWEVGIAP